jgi:Tfp pilus assembly protein PilW
MKKNHRHGFTLVELLLYVSMSGIIILAVSVFLAVLLSARVKNRSVAEVEQQGARSLGLIVQTLRNANVVNSPAVGASASSLSLNTYSGSLNPTVFDLSGGVLRIAEGASAAVALTNSNVAVSGLSFQNLSYASTPGIMRIQFTVSYINNSGSNEYDYSKSFSASAALRQP